MFQAESSNLLIIYLIVITQLFLHNANVLYLGKLLCCFVFCPCQPCVKHEYHSHWRVAQYNKPLIELER